MAVAAPPTGPDRVPTLPIFTMDFGPAGVAGCAGAVPAFPPGPVGAGEAPGAEGALPAPADWVDVPEEGIGAADAPPDPVE